MRGGEGDVALRTALGELLLVEPVDGATGDELDRHAGLLGEFLGNRIGDQVAPAAAPDADDELVLRLGRDDEGKGKQREQETFHTRFLFVSRRERDVCTPPAPSFCTKQLGSTIVLILPTLV